ncbi:N-acetylglucosamine-6-phosphate deacetylase [Cryobacterium sp. PAMC25264]|uniref:N-acetylglucosamine-6-phosphate deacetylase n=1 Tax=Cryobacterium sp. PAMC25264 TaxID=2861288 RepID=UPI001C635EB9|nr:N-acetylglucosamine-6-phosphate deacetylase [Cryobacterium sp. PAMC25264]QYF75195.1 N-acetylglucosamine-6-phosphate deacetylase [Cryobacterium sp. PAMC25264]
MTETLSQTTLIRAARAVDAHRIIDDVWVLIAGTTIQAVGSGRDAPAAHRVVELGETTLVPGFIDLHGHGGADGAYDNGPDEIAAALAMHRRHGTTRAVLSLVANPLPMLARSLDSIREAMSNDPLILGAHLEGPFLSPDNHGAHQPDHLLEPSRANVNELLNRGQGVLAQITIAPELVGAYDAIKQIVDGGVVAAVGHTVASQHITRRAFDAGATVLTHAFNAMPGIHHREPGPIMAAAEDDSVTLELILDGVHVAPIVARTLFQAVPGRVALITDAMAAAGSPDGAYRLGSLDVTVADGIARVDGTETIAGSTLTQDSALRMAVGQVGLSLTDAVTALTATPAAALGLSDRLGYLAPGFAADLVGLTADLTVSHVWADGNQLALRQAAHF